MDLVPLSRKADILDAFRRLQLTVQQNAEPFEDCVHKSPGEFGPTPKTVYWNSVHKFSSALYPHPSRPFYWCAYGTENPGRFPGKALNIACEINPPVKGINPHVGGAFLRDRLDQRVYYAHSGKLNLTVRGKRVSKQEVQNWFPKEKKPVERLGWMIVLGPVDARSTVSKIARFVHAVEKRRRRQHS